MTLVTTSVDTRSAIARTDRGHQMQPELPLHRDTENIDVVVLCAPRDGPLDEFAYTIAEWRALGRAVLVVLRREVDAGTREHLAAAGADLCVVRARPADLFTLVERARRIHRGASRRAAACRSDTDRGPRSNDDVLDAFWRRRAAASRASVAW